MTLEEALSTLAASTNRVLTTEEQVLSFALDYLAGVPTAVMAEKYGYAAQNAVSAAARRMGLPKRAAHPLTRDMSAEDRARFKRDWADPTLSVRQVAERHGWKTRASATRCAQALRLPARPRAGRNTYHPDNVREHQITNLDTRRKPGGIHTWVDDDQAS